MKVSVVYSARAFRSLSIGFEWGYKTLRFYIGFYRWVFWLTPKSAIVEATIHVYAKEVDQ